MAIFKKRGIWWVGYRANGKRRREPVGTSYSLAKEVLAKRQSEVAERKHFPGRVANALTFGAVADKFWQLHGRTLISPSWNCMMGKIRTSFDSKKIGDINAGDVQSFYNEIASTTSPSTANRYLTLLRLIFYKARSWHDFYGDNPCARGMIKKQREAKHRLRYLEKDEISALYEAASPTIYPILVAAIHTGMRQGELLGLDWKNVSLDRLTIYILQAKSDRSREIPMTNKLREVLEALGPKSEGPVFNVPKITLRRHFAKALQGAHIAGCRFHDLRHTFASHFIMRTNDLPSLQRLLGHATPAMTLRYAHLSNGHLAANMATFEAGMPTKGWSSVLGGHHRGHQLPAARIGKA